MKRSLILETIGKYSNMVLTHLDLTENINIFNGADKEIFGLKLDDTYVLIILSRILSNNVDADIEDLLELDTYMVSIKTWIDLKEKDITYNFMLELTNDILDYGRLDRVLRNIDSIKLDSISNVTTTDRMNNKWSVRIISKNFI
tara:strand:- start:8234 stop:8665 length:432 start_codon:yes stop_codon:yes gene_type:complete